MKIDAIRESIDSLDNEILRLLELRLQAAGMIGVLKASKDIPIYDEEREEKIIAKVNEKLPYQLRKYGVKIYNAILEASRDYQKDWQKPVVGQESD